MAGVGETLTGIICSTLGVLCPDQPPASTDNPGDVPPGFYKSIEPPRVQKPAPKPAALVVPARVEFGTRELGQKPAVLRVRIANAGELDLDVSILEVSGSEAFSLTGECPVIAAGRSCEVTVSFKPVLEGKAAGAVLVGGPGDLKRIALEGVGKAPPKVVVKPKPKPKPVVVVKRPAPKPVPRPDPRISATIRSMDELVDAGPAVFNAPAIAGLQPSALPSSEAAYKLKDSDYQGKGNVGSFEKNVSGLPVERCRIIPTETLVPIVLDSPVNSQICGPVLAHIGVDIYGPDGRIRLLKQGTKIEGSCEPLDDPDASRIAVEFTKITRPDGAVMKLNKAQGADAMGQFGMVGEKFDRVFDKYGPTAIASTIGAIVAYATAPNTNSDGTTVDSPLSAAGDAFNQNIAQIVAEELRNATNRKRRIRIKKGTLLHVKPSNYWYFPSPNRLVQVDPAKAKLTYTCSPGALESTEGRRQNREN